MLVLSRKVGESIMLGEDIEITIIEVKGEQIRIGIKAPQEVKVYRKEIYSAILSENKEASKAPLLDDLQSLASLMKKAEK